MFSRPLSTLFLSLTLVFPLGCNAPEEPFVSSESGGGSEADGGETPEGPEGGGPEECQPEECGLTLEEPQACWDGSYEGKSCLEMEDGCQWVVTQDCPDNPCEGVACGEACMLSTCDDLADDEDCAAIAMMGYCDMAGVCQEEMPECPAFNPCEGKECGASCTLACAPGTEEDCGATATYCSSTGECISDLEELKCEPVECPPESCGPSNILPEICWDGSTPEVKCMGIPEAELCDLVYSPCPGNPCAETVCEGDETCSIVNGEAECVSQNSCMGKACGAPCEPECPPNVLCEPPEGPSFCSPEGDCVENLDLNICTDNKCSEEDCGPQLGIPVQTCWDGSTTQITCEADPAGQCGWVISVCPMNPCDTVDCPPDSICEVVEGEAKCIPIAEDPCAGKSCGDICDACLDGEICPAVETYCDASGACTAEYPQCNTDLCEDFIPPCKETSDCPEGMKCSFEGCNPSGAGCDPETGDIFQTEDCGGGVCISPN